MTTYEMRVARCIFEFDLPLLSQGGIAEREFAELFISKTIGFTEEAADELMDQSKRAAYSRHLVETLSYFQFTLLSGSPWSMIQSDDDWFRLFRPVGQLLERWGEDYWKLLAALFKGLLERLEQPGSVDVLMRARGLYIALQDAWENASSSRTRALLEKSALAFEGTLTLRQLKSLHKQTRLERDRCSTIESEQAYMKVDAQLGYLNGDRETPTHKQGPGNPYQPSRAKWVHQAWLRFSPHLPTGTAQREIARQIVELLKRNGAGTYPHQHVNVDGYYQTYLVGKKLPPDIREAAERERLFINSPLYEKTTLYSAILPGPDALSKFATTSELTSPAFQWQLKNPHDRYVVSLHRLVEKKLEAKSGGSNIERNHQNMEAAIRAFVESWMSEGDGLDE